MGYYKPFGPEIPRGQRFGANPGWGPNPAGGHNGDDYLSPTGTPVYAAGDGVVVYAGRFDSTYADNWGWNLNFGGLMIILNLDGADAPYVEYGHNSELLVRTGDRVTGGQVIALSGADDGGTHVITGPHLHVGCLPPNFDLGTSTYGRVNPDIYLTKYWAGGVNYASTESTTSIEGFLMALTDEEQRRILAWADRGLFVLDRPRAKVLTNEDLPAIADAVLYRDVEWFGFDGKRQPEGQRHTTTPALALGWSDAIATSQARLTNSIKESLTGGVPVDVKALAAQLAPLLSTQQAHQFIVALGAALPKE
ncbi:M23 family metallopeptidase [Arthrobacter sp. FW306-06-A]|uniref:M23 family metallopeptidase n=1 Tax=Arthrobacter sp. FW306-06-A TaxID=2879621 RepID=UPI001F201D28|nr:M23 family metallopeptidase [Arthrobacter sp. FW306-06-A]UKA69592.1 M23 family metallopeptidase [Arthrobacter sp. FW306-06-A]